MGISLQRVAEERRRQQEGMAVHRLLAVLFVMVLATAMAAGGDGDYVGGGAVDAHSGLLGEAASPRDPLPSGKGDEETAPIKDPDSHVVDDAVIDENIEKPTFYKRCDFKGTKVEIDTSINDVGQVGIAPNDISSFKVPEGYLVTICSEKNFEGSCKVFEPGSIHCLVNYEVVAGSNWDDEIESVKVQTSKITPLS